MKLSTLGHATLLLTAAEGSAPILVTDPWLFGSCYWRSWWLERPPSKPQIEQIAQAQYCYLTHEHPDHFHTPSLRRIGHGPEYLVPELSRDMMGQYLREHGSRARTLAAGTWHALTDNVRVLSLPTLGNDSALLIDTPHALIANLNDARPTPDQLLLLRRLRRAAGRNKRCILLASYSSAGIAHSLYRGGQRVDFAGANHTRYVSMLARVLEADAYIPFASHVRFERPDTRWANAYRVSPEAVSGALSQAGVEALPAYVTLDLATGEHHCDADRSSPDPRDTAERVRQQLSSEARSLNAEDEARLEHKLRAAGRTVLACLFPRGIGFELPEQRLHYDTLRGRVREGEHVSSISFRMPAQALKDVLASGYFSDLCIPMFTEVHLGPETLPHAAYAFFVLMQLHDVGATTGAAAIGRSLRLSVIERARLFRAAAA